MPKSSGGIDAASATAFVEALDRRLHTPIRPFRLAVALLGPDGRRDVCVAAAAYCMKSILSTSAPVSIFFLLRWFEDPEAPVEWLGWVEDLTGVKMAGLAVGCLWAGVNCCTLIGQHIFHKKFALKSAYVGVRCQLAARGVMHRRTQLLSVGLLGRFKTGDLVMLLSTDAKSIADLWTGAVTLVLQPFEIIATIGILWLAVGPASLGALALAAISYGMANVLGKKFARYQAAQSSCADLRIKYLGEVLSGVKVVKTNGWMPKFHARIQEVAAKESRKSLLRKVCMSFILLNSQEIIDLMCCTVSILSVIVFEQFPKGANLFTMLVVMGVLHGKIFAFPEAVRSVLTAYSSLKRCTTFLNLVPETQPSALHHTPDQATPSTVCLAICDGKFSYTECHEGAFDNQGSPNKIGVAENHVPVLKDVNLELQNGMFYTVVGPVGSGKTSFLLSAMGELVASSNGSLRCLKSGFTYAYVPQDPIIFQCSLRENVCFGKPFEEEWFRKVCDACALSDDIKNLPNGDATILGSRGINISGGQQSRICLARAVYSKADAYLLDDPLAKLDVRVSNEVFQRVILGVLGQCLRIMVTTNHAHVKCSDAIITVRDGTAHCSHSHEVTEFFSQKGERSNSKTLLTEGALEDDSDDVPLLQNTAVECEERVFGFAYFLRHFAAGLGSPVRLCFYCMMMACYACTVEVGYYCLALVSDDPEGKNHPLSWYITIYGACVGTQYFVFSPIRYMIISCGTQRGWDKLHASLLHSILNSSLLWLQGVPVGQLLQIFSSTLGDIDETIFIATELFAQTCIFLVAMTIVICNGIPILSIFLAAVFAYYIVWPRMKSKVKSEDDISVARQRHKALERECVQSYTDMLGGLSVVRTFPSARDWFTQHFDDVLGESATTCVSCLKADESSLLRTNLGGAIIYTSIAFAAVLSRKDLTPGYAGYLMANCCYFSFVLTFMKVNFLVLLEVARKRDLLMHLIRSVPQEGENVSALTSGVLEIPKVWPSKGHLVFKGLEVRYQAALPPALRDLSFEIHGAEHFGLVGRTGSGKSTVLLAISRLIEPGKGCILLDSVNICQIGLQALRQQLCVLSQDPLFFSGTLRENLDPFTEHSDEEVWKSMDGMSYDMFSKGQGLATSIAELGGNLSTGQRQLLCLARAVLKSSRLLLVDEATAALDDVAEKHFRQALEDRFRSRDITVVEVAHRLQSICSCDHIGVMDQGVMVEIGTPMELLQPLPLGGKIFQSMVAALGEAGSQAFCDEVCSRSPNTILKGSQLKGAFKVPLPPPPAPAAPPPPPADMPRRILNISRAAAEELTAEEIAKRWEMQKHFSMG